MQLKEFRVQNGYKTIFAVYSTETKQFSETSTIGLRKIV